MPTPVGLVIVLVRFAVPVAVRRACRSTKPAVANAIVNTMAKRTVTLIGSVPVLPPSILLIIPQGYARKLIQV